MKNTQFTSRRTDLRIIAIVGCCALAGLLLPLLIHSDPGLELLFDPIISIPLTLLVWCLFHLVQPSRYTRRYSHKWIIAEWTVVPLVWLLLMLAFDVWVHRLWLTSELFYQRTQML